MSATEPLQGASLLFTTPSHGAPEKDEKLS